MKVGIGNHTNAELFQELKEQRIQFNQFALQLFEDQMIQTKQRGQTLSVLEGLRKSGLETTTLGRWFRFDVRELGFDKTNTVIFWSSNQEFGDWKESKEDFMPYKETELLQLSELPSKTLCFYQERIHKEEVPLLFFRTPHVLFKGSVGLKNGHEITIV
ncbi:hypothetical protein [Vibrio harveyi]